MPMICPQSTNNTKDIRFYHMDAELSNLNSKNSTRKGSALIAMSGGVDSAVAAMLAVRGGYDCAGAYLKLCNGTENAAAVAESVAGRLGIPFYKYDFTETFDRRVVLRFVSEYREGRTPNPCVDCNKHIKFGLLLQRARELGADYFITGHYAKIERDNGGRYCLKKGADNQRIRVISCMH